MVARFKFHSSNTAFPWYCSIQRFCRPESAQCPGSFSAPKSAGSVFSSLNSIDPKTYTMMHSKPEVEKLFLMSTRGQRRQVAEKGRGGGAKGESIRAVKKGMFK